MDYEVVKYIVKFGEEQKETFTEEEALSLYEQHKDKKACVYQIKRMVL